MKPDCVKTICRMLFAALLFCVLLISCAYAQTSVFEGVTTPETDFSYIASTAEDGTTYSVITKYNGKASVVVVPSILGGHPVKEIGEWAFENTSITHIDIPSSVTVIGNAAFRNTKLQTIDLSQCVGMTVLGGNMFAECKSLTDVKLPAGLTTIMPRAFYGCSALETLDIPDSVHTIEYDAFKDCTSLTTAPWPRSFKNFTYNDDNGGPFAGCTALTEIVIPEGAKTIPNDVFAGSCVEKVTIPSTVKSISKSAFRNQTTVKSITATGLTGIEAKAFSGNTVLETIDLSACTSLGSIGEEVFKNCTALVDLRLPEGLTYIGKDAFKGCTGLKKLHIPDTVTQIYRQAFESCTALEEINYPKNLQQIMYNAKVTPYDRTEPVFYKCNNIKKAVVPEGTTSIIGQYFTNLSALETVVLPSTLKTISNNSFGGCASLKEITLPASLEKIYSSAFSGCASLESINIPSLITSIENNTFANCTNLQSPDLTHITAIGVDAFKNCTSITELQLGNALTSISGFSGCTGLTQIVLPASVKYINNNAFNGCAGLTDVDVPSSVTSIGDGAFLNCPNITIWCKSGSAAHRWAADNNVSFVLYDAHTHQFEFFKTVQPSCTERGETQNKCSICGFRQAIDVTPALGHIVPENFTQISQVSCTTDGVWVKRCSRCGLVHERKKESRTGHTFTGDWIITRQPTIYSSGRKEKACTDCDSVIWQSIAQLPLPEELASTHSTALFTVVNANTAEPISGANLEVTVNGLDVLFTTNVDGKVQQLLPIGEHIVTVWYEGMRSRTLTIEVTNEGNGSCTIDHIGLSETEFISAELTVNEMTVEEMEAAGIDTSNPDNQHVSRYQLSLSFSSSIADLNYNYYKNNGGALVAGGGLGGIPGGSHGGEWVTIGEPVGDIPIPPVKFEPDDPEKVTVTVYPLSEEMYLIIYGDVCWLKEMFDVELMVLNNTLTEKLTQVYATLTLPKGLSLACTQGEQQNSSILLGTIEGGARQSAHWYVRGDAEGDYDLTASLSAITDPHCEVIEQEYTTKESIHVYGSSAMKLTWYLPDTAYANEEYIARAVLENVTEDRTLYNVSHMITGLKKAKVTYYSNQTVKESVEIDDGRLAGGFAREFAPGEQLVIELSIPVTTDSDVVKRQAAGYEAAIREMEKLYSALPLVRADQTVMDSLTVFLQELNMMKDAGLLTNSGTALSAMENALKRAKLLQDNTAIQQEILQAFSALKEVVSAIPVRYELMESELTVLTDAASSIPMQVRFTGAGGDQITSLETYLENFINTLVDMRLAADGGIVPPNFTIETLTQAKDNMAIDTLNTIHLATGSSKTFLIQASEGAKIWSQHKTLTLDVLGSDAIVKDGKIVINGSCYIQVTPGQQDDTLYVEMNGTTRQIHIKVTEAHTCSGQWTVVYYATEETDGFEVQLCSACQAVLETRTTKSCGNHVFAETAVSKQTLWSIFPSAYADELLSVQTRVCRKEACHVLKYDIVDGSGMQQKMITFHPNGGQGDMSPMSGTVNGACILPSCTFTNPEGFFFLCWNTRADGQGTSFKPGESFPLTDHTALYACWLPGGSLVYDMSQVALEKNVFNYDTNCHTITITGLPEGVSVESITGNSGVNAGHYTVIAQLTTNDPLYEIPVLPEMTWDILPQPVTVKADDHQAVFTGQEIFGNGYTIEHLLSGHRLANVDISGSATAIGHYPGLLMPGNAHIVDADNLDVTSNYQITYVPGDLTITKADQAQLNLLTLSKNHRANIRSVRLDSIQVNPAGQSIIKNSQIRNITFLLTDAMSPGNGVHLTGGTHVESVTLNVGTVPGSLDALIGDHCLLTLEEQSSVGMLMLLGDPALFKPQWIFGAPEAIHQVMLAQTGQTLSYSQWIASFSSPAEQ